MFALNQKQQHSLQNSRRTSNGSSKKNESNNQQENTLPNYRRAGKGPKLDFSNDMDIQAKSPPSSIMNIANIDSNLGNFSRGFEDRELCLGFKNVKSILKEKSITTQQSTQRIDTKKQKKTVHFNKQVKVQPYLRECTTDLDRLYKERKKLKRKLEVHNFHYRVNSYFVSSESFNDYQTGGSNIG